MCSFRSAGGVLAGRPIAARAFAARNASRGASAWSASLRRLHLIEVLLREYPVPAGLFEVAGQFRQPDVTAAQREPRGGGELGERVRAGRDVGEALLEFVAIGGDAFVGEAEGGEVAFEVRGRVGRAQRQPPLPRREEHHNTQQEHRHLPDVLRRVGSVREAVSAAVSVAMAKS